MQREFIGFGSLNELREVLQEYDAHTALVVTGKKSFTYSGAKKRISQLLDDVNIIYFDAFSSNPNLDEVLHGISVFQKINPDLVIAIGGGSVIDIAKLITSLSVQKEKPEMYITGKRKIIKAGVPLVAIPTTSGTGSESTFFATVYIDKKKYSVGNPDLTLPTVTFVDPALTMSLLPYQSAVTGLDALCQGIESLCAVQSTKESRKYAKKAVDLAIKSIIKVVTQPNEDTRFAMSQAAHFSGKAINISKTTACHSISYPITAHFGIPHGHAVALTMGEMIKFNSQVTGTNCNDIRGTVFVKTRIREIVNLLDSRTAIDAKNKLNILMKRIGVESKLHKLGIDVIGRDIIVHEAFTPDRMNNNPRVLSKNNLIKIINNIA